LLKSVAIYGANGSGKSNLMKAMQRMQVILFNNIKLHSTDELKVVPFLLSTETENQPSFFEIVFLFEDIKYRYGFEIDRSKVHSEWLFETKKESEKPLFFREEQNIQIFTAFKEGKGLEERASTNRLFLSIVEQFNGSVAQKLFRHLIFHLSHFSSFDLERASVRKLNRDFFSNPENKKLAIELFQEIGLNFRDFKFAVPTDNQPNVDENKGNEAKTIRVQTVHNKYDDNRLISGDVLFDLERDESRGTNKLFECSATIIAFLKTGATLTLDELDTSLHPLMTLAIIKLFNSNTNNPNNAQFIFTTHDTNLLSKGGLRRDQIYFIEKDNYEASHLYSLAEFKIDGKKVRNDASYEEDYIQGRYGAIPFIGDFSKLLGDAKEKEN
jgi:hypothetical protein